MTDAEYDALAAQWAEKYGKQRHLRPVAPVFRESAPPPSRLRRAWDVVVDFAFMTAAVAAVFWSDRRRRRWEP